MAGKNDDQGHARLAQEQIDLAASAPNLIDKQRHLNSAAHFATLNERSRADGSVLCVRRTDRGLCLNDRAPAAPVRLTQCEPQTAIYCSSGRSSLRAATARQEYCCAPRGDPSRKKTPKRHLHHYPRAGCQARSLMSAILAC